MARAERLMHPAFTGTVAVLAVNDHVLKGHGPALVTGKLSDLAGLFVVAVVAAVVLGGVARWMAGPGTAPAAGRTLTLKAVTATGIAFIALKLSPAVADLAAPVLGGSTRTDPTDLVALLVLVPAYLFIVSAADVAPDNPGSPRPRPPHPLPPAGVVEHPSVRRLGSFVGASTPAGRPPATAPGCLPQTTPLRRQRPLRLMALLLVATATTLSVTATSCLDAEGVIGLAVTSDGLVAAVGPPSATDPAFGPPTYYRSGDGGQTWALYEPDSPPSIQPATEGCGSNERCYRVADRRRVETTSDGSRWETAFNFSDDQLHRMDLRSDSCSGAGDIDQFYTSLAVIPDPGSNQPPGTGTDAGTGAAGTDTGSDTSDDTTAGIGTDTVVVSMGSQGYCAGTPRRAPGPGTP